MKSKWIESNQADSQPVEFLIHNQSVETDFIFGVCSLLPESTLIELYWNVERWKWGRWHSISWFWMILWWMPFYLSVNVVSFIFISFQRHLRIHSHNYRIIFCVWMCETNDNQWSINIDQYCVSNNNIRALCYCWLHIVFTNNGWFADTILNWFSMRFQTSFE